MSYKRIPLRPYPGEIKLFDRLDHMRAYYEAHTGNKYEYQDEATGGRYIKLERDKAKDAVWLVYGRKPHVIAHEFTHVLLQLWKAIGSDPYEGNGEPFCYMLSQLMIESKWK